VEVAGVGRRVLDLGLKDATAVVVGGAWPTTEPESLWSVAHEPYSTAPQRI
jgi:hypothetical protein